MKVDFRGLNRALQQSAFKVIVRRQLSVCTHEYTQCDVIGLRITCAYVATPPITPTWVFICVDTKLSHVIFREG